VWEEGFCDETTRDKDWVAYGELLLTGEEPLEEFERVKDIVGRFCASKSKAELMAGSFSRRLLIAPVNMIDDVVGLPHFTAREYWHDVEGVRHPGVFARASATPLHVLGRAPRLGEHTDVVLAELDRATSRAATGPSPRSDAPGGRPLEGVRVLDFMWVMAGPATTRVLADLGATVVRVESSHRVETARTLIPFRDDVNTLESSCLFANMNAGKLGLALDPSTPEGRAVVLDLVRWADVVTESFSPKAMRAWGLGYPELRAVNPSIVMLSSCLFGQTGPLAEFAGFGTMAAAISGFFGITGWPDRAPCGPFGAYTDYISPRFSTAVLLAALDHRRRTGEGQYIDFAQAEAAIHAIAPAILHYTVNGQVWERAGNSDPEHHPHGVFRCAGEDRWIALACADDDQRAALAGITGGLDDDTITAWTTTRDPDEAARVLQLAGVPSHPVQNSGEAWADAHLHERRHFRTLVHPTVGEIVIEGPRFVLSRTPADPLAAGPTLGQHTTQVLTEILGYDDERLVDLLVSGALE
jgi:crotonobetainyl-CoA:carnitine CoA-transferase CaiB-like acyl-CoA transferase